MLSYSYCGECYVCKQGLRSHCISFFNINFMGEEVFEGGVGGRFFGQSSFAKHSIVSGKSVVNVTSAGLSRDDMKLLAPLGCGMQTGSGTVVKVAKATPQDCLVVAGIGGVGLAAVLAARNVGCKAIIAVDKLASRLELAKSLGATHIVDTTGLSMEDVANKIREAAEGLGATISIDTTAYPPLVGAMVEASRYTGRIIQVGTGMPGATLDIPMQTFMVSAKQYFGAVQGHALTEESVPQMISWWKEGKFEVDKLVKLYDVKDFESAVKAMGSGEVIKPVIVW